MTTPISSTGSVDASSYAQQATSGASGSTIGKDAFLKLLVAQISHQDPLKPMEGTEYVTQLAQFNAVEQAIAQSQRLDIISTQLSGLGANEAVNLVGKEVSLRGQTLSFDGSNPAHGNVSLAGPAASVVLTVTDASGNVVRTVDLGAKPAGPLDVAWDGRNDTGVAQPPGAYQFSVTAKNGNGAAVQVSKDVSGTVVKVTFDKGYPEVVLDSGITASISDLVSAGAAKTTP